MNDTLQSRLAGKQGKDALKPFDVNNFGVGRTGIFMAIIQKGMAKLYHPYGELSDYIYADMNYS